MKIIKKSLKLHIRIIIWKLAYNLLLNQIKSIFNKRLLYTLGFFFFKKKNKDGTSLLQEDKIDAIAGDGCENQTPKPAEECASANKLVAIFIDLLTKTGLNPTLV